MDSDSSNQVSNIRRLKILASEVRYPSGNNLLHQFVLDHSDPNNSVSQNYINAVLLSMNGSAVDVHAFNDDGYNPLQLAVLKQNLLMVKKLLSCCDYIQVSARSDDVHKNTALQLAVKLGHLSIIRELLNKGAQVNMKNSCNRTALYFAVKSGNLDIVKLLVSKGASLDFINRGWGALHCAARSGNIEILKFLLSNGADVNTKDQHGLTPLHHAARSGDLATVKFLVSQSADVNAIDRFRETPLHKAARSGTLDIIKFLIDRGVNVNVESVELLLCAAQSGDLGSVQFLIDKGADVNAKDKKHNRTPLHTAVRNNNLEALQFLVEKGANVNAIDSNGQTPLHHLLEMLKYPLDLYYDETDNESDNEPDKINIALMKIKLLLEANANVNIEDKYGRTPLWCAVDFGNSDIVKLFLEREVDLNIKYFNGDTLLHHACKCDDKLDMIEMLLTKGRDVNAKNIYGRTPLHATVCRNNAAYTQLLLERGASVHIADIDGWTPLHSAAYRGHVEMIRTLLDKGADRNAINRNGKTPLDVAKEFNRQLCMDALQ